MTNIEIADAISNGLFAKRDTIDEAMKYAIDVVERLGQHEKVAAYTAIMVLTNTIADQIRQNERDHV